VAELLRSPPPPDRRRCEAEQQLLSSAFASASHCWREETMDCSSATVDRRQMEVCLSILPLIVGLSLRCIIVAISLLHGVHNLEFWIRFFLSI
jgi:hypothetical protein